MRHIIFLTFLLSFLFINTGVAQEQELADLPFPEGEIMVKEFGGGTNIYTKDWSFDKIVSKYKGSVVYVDLWASWCGPCLKQMKHAAKLKKEFKGKKVVFVYVSVDKKEREWKKGIKRNRIKGEHYLLSEKNAGKLSLAHPSFTSIPRYMIVDKKGKIREDNAPSPELSSTRKLIKKYLKKR